MSVRWFVSHAMQPIQSIRIYVVSTRQGVDPPTKVFVADMPIKQLTGIDEYFKRLGWGTLPQVCIP